MTVYCTELKCEYNDDGFCMAEKVDFDGVCLTYREYVPEEIKEESE